MKSAFEVTLYYPSGRIREFHYPMPKNAVGTDTVLNEIRNEYPFAFCIVVSRNGKESQWINPNYRRVKK